MYEISHQVAHHTWQCIKDTDGHRTAQTRVTENEKVPLLLLFEQTKRNGFVESSRDLRTIHERKSYSRLPPSRPPHHSLITITIGNENTRVQRGVVTGECKIVAKFVAILILNKFLFISRLKPELS